MKTNKLLLISVFFIFLIFEFITVSNAAESTCPSEIIMGLTKSVDTLEPKINKCNDQDNELCRDALELYREASVTHSIIREYQQSGGFCKLESSLLDKRLSDMILPLYNKLAKQGLI